VSNVGWAIKSSLIPRYDITNHVILSMVLVSIHMLEENERLALNITF